MRLLFALILALLPATVLSQGCVTAEDLAGGIRVTFDNGDETDLRLAPDGRIAVTERYSWSPEGYLFLQRDGIYTEEEVRLDAAGGQIPDSRIRYIYPSGLPRPAADALPWDGTRSFAEVGLAPLPESYRVAFRAAEPLVLNGCRYEVLAVGVRLREGAADQKDQFSYYLTDLGASFIVAWTDTETGNFQETRPISITALR